MTNQQKSQDKFDPRRRTATSKRKPLNPLTLAALDDVLKDIGIEHYDAIVVGDGSGTDWKRGCGWSSVLVDHYGSYRVHFFGAWNLGTSHIAEILPYIQALTWYAAGPGRARKADLIKDGDPKAAIKIHIISDNANIVNCGNRVCERGTYAWLWDVFTSIEREGFVLKWHWLERNLLALNRLTDYCAGFCRTWADGAMKEMEEGLGKSMEELVYEFNPTVKP